MPGFKLLTSQKNQIFELIQHHKFQPSEFQWQDYAQPTGITVPRLLHLPSGFWIYFERYDEKGFFVTYSPAEDTYQADRNPGTWAVTLKLANVWLGYLKRETEVPDLWESLAKDTQLIQDANNQPLDNLPFTAAELPRVRKALEEIKAYVHKTHELSDTQKRIIDSRFDYLEKKAEEFGRKDWIHIVISILLGIGVDQLQSGDGTRDLFLFAREVFKQALGTVLYLAGPH